MKNVIDLFTLIVYLAIIATVLASKNTRADLAAVGNVFTGSIKAAKQG